MASEVEDPLSGSFWKALEREKDLVRQIEKECLLVCVPLSSSLARALGGRAPNRAFLLDHTFKASPFFLGEFESVSKTVTIGLSGSDVEIKRIGTGELHPAVKVAVLAEELMYPTSASLKKTSYRILTVAQPLDRLPLKTDASAGGSSTTGRTNPFTSFLASFGSKEASSLDYPEVDSFESAQLFFQRWPENLLVLRKFAAACQALLDSEAFSKPPHSGGDNNNNNSLKGKQDYPLTVKIKSLIDEYAQALTITNRVFKDLYKASPQQLDPMYRLVVAYSMGFLFEKLYTQVCIPTTKKADQQLQELLYSVFDHSAALASEMGVPDTLLLPYTKAIERIGQLPVYQSPGEKIHCLRATVKLINVDIEESASPLLGSRSIMVTNDELIPILAYVICSARLSNCFANLMFLEDFSFIPNKAVSPDAFLVTTLSASLEYLKSFLADKYPNTSVASPTPSHKSIPIALSLSSLSSQPLPPPSDKPASPSGFAASPSFYPSSISPLPSPVLSSLPPLSPQTRVPSPHLSVGSSPRLAARPVPSVDLDLDLDLIDVTPDHIPLPFTHAPGVIDLDGFVELSK